MKRLRGLLLLSCLMTLESCMVPPNLVGYRIHPRNMRDELQYRGFSVARPIDPSWYKIAGEDSPVEVLFHSDTESRTHTFFAAAYLVNHGQGQISAEEFQKFLQAKITEANSRNTSVSYQSHLTKRQGQAAVEWFVEWEDRGARYPGVNVLFAYMKGLAVLHPTIEGAYVDAAYSERGLKEEVKGRSFTKSGDYFLDHLIIYDAPGRKTGQQ